MGATDIILNKYLTTICTVKNAKNSNNNNKTLYGILNIQVRGRRLGALLCESSTGFCSKRQVD